MEAKMRMFGVMQPRWGREEGHTGVTTDTQKKTFPQSSSSRSGLEPGICGMERGMSRQQEGPAPGHTLTY